MKNRAHICVTFFIFIQNQLAWLSNNLSGVKKIIMCTYVLNIFQNNLFCQFLLDPETSIILTGITRSIALEWRAVTIAQKY
jgi:hypothetical protein